MAEALIHAGRYDDAGKVLEAATEANGGGVGDELLLRAVVAAISFFGVKRQSRDATSAEALLDSGADLADLKSCREIARADAHCPVLWEFAVRGLFDQNTTAETDAAEFQFLLHVFSIAAAYFADCDPNLWALALCFNSNLCAIDPVLEAIASRAWMRCGDAFESAVLELVETLTRHGESPMSKLEADLIARAMAAARPTGNNRLSIRDSETGHLILDLEIRSDL